jgi:ribosomal protein S18 acetylase RimI-like enzyme
MPKIEYIENGQRGLDEIGFLWEKLREHHMARAPYHTAYFARMTWDVRKKLLLEKITDGHLRVDIVKDTVTGKLVGYCISSVTAAKMGEIDSIFIEKDYRHQGIGDNFMKRALEWMDGVGISKKIIGVAVGNEEAFPFYARYGFYPRSTILNRPEEA